MKNLPLVILVVGLAYLGGMLLKTQQEGLPLTSIFSLEPAETLSSNEDTSWMDRAGLAENSAQPKERDDEAGGVEQGRNLLAPTPTAETPSQNGRASPDVILKLKKDHAAACAPNIKEQLRVVGLNAPARAAQDYCACVGSFYFNDLRNSEFAEMVERNGTLPVRIETRRVEIQEHCAALHIDG